MLLRIPQILTAEDVAECRDGLAKADWTDGRATAGHQSTRVKRNTQARYDDPTAQRLGQMILYKIQRHPLFISASLPFKIVPPLFNRYAEGEYYGPHIDGAIRPIEGTAHRVRTDLSATIFLSAPEDYDGGELVIEDTFGDRRIKLPAGDMILYPGTSVHHVEPVTRGARLASFFWVQSMVRDDGDRTMLLRLDSAIQDLQRNVPDQPAIVHLTNLYHNLLRRWADA